MYEFLVAKTTALLAPAIGCEKGDRTYDRLWYGTYVFYLNVCKTVALVIVALALGILPYVLVFMAALGLLRAFSFGVHLSNPALCTALGFAYYLGFTYFSLVVPVPLAVEALLLGLCVLAVARYAPAQTKRRPIKEKDRKPFKVKSLCVLLVEAVAVIVLHGAYPVYSTLICTAAVCQSANLLPITYKLLTKGEIEDVKSEDDS